MAYGPYSYTKMSKEKNPNTNDVSNDTMKEYTVTELPMQKYKKGRVMDYRTETVYKKMVNTKKKMY